MEQTIKPIRNEFVDSLKGIAIILVVSGHSIQYGNGITFLTEGLFFDENLFKIIYSFHMPLFMLISGYFFHRAVQKYNSLKAFFSDRVTKLLVPILIWNVFNYFELLLLGEVKLNVYSLLLFLCTNFWFLWAIFWNSLVIFIVKIYFNDNIYIYIFGFFLLFVLPDVYELSKYKFMYPYFVIGYFCNKRKILEYKVASRRTFLLVAFGLMYILLIPEFNYNSYINTTGITIINKEVLHQVIINLYRYVIGLTGSVFVILLYSFFSRKVFVTNGKFLAKLGTASLGIYVISGFFFPVLSAYSKQLSFSYFNCIIETIFILLFSYLLTRVLQHFWVTNKFLFGGRFHS